ncbi:hypothetical protein FKO59_08760 [Burkholderia pseudomallei]|nr:hypothetical protein FKO59_08760 [Burkholderia pseudomallei]
MAWASRLGLGLGLGSRTLDLGPWTLDLGPWALGLGPWALGLGPWGLGPRASETRAACVGLQRCRPSDLPTFRAPAPRPLGSEPQAPAPKRQSPPGTSRAGFIRRARPPSPPIAGDGACDYAPIPSRISSRDSRSSRYSVR